MTKLRKSVVVLVTQKELDGMQLTVLYQETEVDRLSSEIYCLC